VKGIVQAKWGGNAGEGEAPEAGCPPAKWGGPSTLSRKSWRCSLKKHEAAASALAFSHPGHANTF